MAAEEPTCSAGLAVTCWNYLEVVDPARFSRRSATWLTHISAIQRRAALPNFADPNTGYRA